MQQSIGAFPSCRRCYFGFPLSCAVSYEPFYWRFPDSSRLKPWDHRLCRRCPFAPSQYQDFSPVSHNSQVAKKNCRKTSRVGECKWSAAALVRCARKGGREGGECDTGCLRFLISNPNVRYDSEEESAAAGSCVASPEDIAYINFQSGRLLAIFEVEQLELVDLPRIMKRCRQHWGENSIRKTK